MGLVCNYYAKSVVDIGLQIIRPTLKMEMDYSLFSLTIYYCNQGDFHNQQYSGSLDFEV